MTQIADTLTFDGTDLTLIDHAGQRWLTAADVARALGYQRADSVARTYDRNKAEFSDEMALTVNLTVRGAVAPRPVRIFSPRGARLIAMFARTPKAERFRAWVLDVLDATATLGAPPLPSLDEKRVAECWEVAGQLAANVQREAAAALLQHGGLDYARFMLTVCKGQPARVLPIKHEAVVMDVEELIKDVMDAEGISFTNEQLFRVINAAAFRLNHRANLWRQRGRPAE